MADSKAAQSPFDASAALPLRSLPSAGAATLTPPSAPWMWMRTALPAGICAAARALVSGLTWRRTISPGMAAAVAEPTAAARPRAMMREGLSWDGQRGGDQLGLVPTLV